MHKQINIAAAFLLLSIAAASVLIFTAARPAPTLGSASDNILHSTPTATKVWVGTSDTLVAATSTGRLYLEIGNISGATSSAQALYCNVGGRPSVAYEGLVIHASTTKAFGLDNLIRGEIRCRFPASSSTVTVIDF